MPTNIEIAQQAHLRHIREIAAKVGVPEELLEYYGNYKAKLPLSLIDREKGRKGRLILVSAITPTPAGEGKTTTSVGLAQGLEKIGRKSIVVLREPSMGPVFGIKGGAAGGGYSQVLPMEDINLHFTGDFSAVEKAHNLLTALIDNNLQNRKYSLGIDPRTVVWKRVMDLNDRALRHLVIGLGGPSHGVPREAGFDITAASEVMAILCLSENLADLKQRLGNIYVANTYEGNPVFARDLKAQGAMAALLKDAIKPNLVQTIEGTPALIHGGPFANIAQGTNSVIATRMGLSLADYVVTEAGFGFDLGAEKFLHIKCGYSGLTPHAVVLVATLRALKYHGSGSPDHLDRPDPEALKKGLCNLEKHIENAAILNIRPVVAINRFDTDTDEELQLVRQHCAELGVKAATVDAWGRGGEGSIELAELVMDTVAAYDTPFQPLYEWDWSIKKKIEAIATRIYGATTVAFRPDAKKDLDKINKLGLDKLPVCIAKTPLSLSENPKKYGRPRDFVLTIRELEVAAGAGFVIPITGQTMRMPGLPSKPSAEIIDIDDQGRISGLF
ncbi:MAG: formate--tetrahydrofolate ligase [Desulfuromonadaceae bacterium]|nr:formate--tetrahydrofolate ligase [Desulfuromonadaceae bacterium]